MDKGEWLLQYCWFSHVVFGQYGAEYKQVYDIFSVLQEREDILSFHLHKLMSDKKQQVSLWMKYILNELNLLRWAGLSPLYACMFSHKNDMIAGK